MFENLRAAFREAVDNFNQELHRDQVPEAVDRLLRGMRDEAAEAKTRLHDLDVGIQQARAEAEREKQGAATCLRRQAMAQSIGDEETARIAGEYAEKHVRRQTVLEQKADALAEELTVRKAEIEEMLDKIREAQRNRDTLAASAGRSTARESIRGTQDLFEELDRMADKVTGEDSRAQAAQDLLDEMDRDHDPLDDLSIDLDGPPPRPLDVDARLAELKRRMN
ncbi:MAG TPA: hypothetical protein VGA70_10945, partial [Longimicrobiales bacterium]